MAYQYSNKITIPVASIGSELTNFPLDVYLDSQNFDFSACKTDGSDIEFTDANSTPLKFERKEHNSTTEKAYYTVLVPTISATVNTEIYINYGDANAYNKSIEAWQDQTGKTLTYNGNVKLVTGIVTGKRVASFDGIGDYFTLNGQTDFAFGTSDFCIEIIYKPTVIGTQDYIYDSRPASTASGAYVTLLAESGTLYFISNGYYNIQSGITLSINTTYKIKLCRNSGVTRLYIDGNQEGSSYTDTTTYLNGASRPTIGTSGYSTTSPIDGYLMGMRITKGRSRAGDSMPTTFDIDGSDVVLCTNFDTIYDESYSMVQHMGDTLTDASGNGNNGTATGTTVVDTIYGKVRSFNGTSDFIQFPATSIQADNANYSIIAMFYPQDLTNAFQLIKYHAGTLDNMFHFGIRSATGTPANGSTIAYYSDDLDSGVTHSLNSWYVIAATNVASTKVRKIFNEGSLSNSDTSTGALALTNDNVMWAGKSSTTFQNGDYGEIRTSSITRSDDWIEVESKSIKNTLLIYELILDFTLPTFPYTPSADAQYGSTQFTQTMNISNSEQVLNYITMTSQGYSTINSYSRNTDGTYTVNITIYSYSYITLQISNLNVYQFFPTYNFQTTPTIQIHNYQLNSDISVYNSALTTSITHSATTGTYNSSITHSTTVNITVPATWFIIPNRVWKLNTSQLIQCTTTSHSGTHTKTEPYFNMCNFPIWIRYNDELVPVKEIWVRKDDALSLVKKININKDGALV